MREPLMPRILMRRGGAPADAGAGGDPGAAEQDWIERSMGSGVVWAHDFRNPAEVDLFRWTGGYVGGNDPLALGTGATKCRRITTDGVTGGACLEQFRPDGINEVSGAWIRPFSAVNNNGRGFPDPAASGTVPVENWDPTDGGSQTVGWGTKGVYGHSSFAGPGFDGTEFFLQMRIKMDPRRSLGSNANVDVGKLSFIGHTTQSNVLQELVTYSRSHPGASGSPNYHRVYKRTGGFIPLEQGDSLARPGQQVGSNLANYGASQFCDVTTQPGNCWAWSGGWDTVMYNIVPGRPNVTETVIRVLAANEGQSSYTKIWDLITSIDYDFSNGFNAFLTSTYNNDASMQEFWHRYDQIILSKLFVRCPQPTVFVAPSWFA